MSFYESISAYYDDIFSASEESVRFLHARTPPEGRLLDLACGTGNHSHALAALGHQVVGIDLDGAMIQKARDKQTAAGNAQPAAGNAQPAAGNAQPAAGPEARFHVADMCQIKPLFGAGETLHLIYCLGNSLVHLNGEREIAGVLKDSFDLLEPRGRLVVQIVNYDRILMEKIVELPPIESKEKELVFLRRYDWRPGSSKVHFKTELKVGGRSIGNSIPLFILKSSVLLNLFAEAGFQEIELFGSFKEDPYGPGSFPAIACGRKPAVSKPVAGRINALK